MAAQRCMLRSVLDTWTRSVSSSTTQLTVIPDPPSRLTLSAALLNQANSDGWTPAHMAAALGIKECLEVLCSHSEQDVERRDKCNRTIHDVATDDCKDLLENLDSYRVLVLLMCSSGGTGSMCPMEALEEEEEAKGPSSSQMALGRVTVDRSTRWAQLRDALSHMFVSHLQILCGDCQTAREEAQRSLLGLTPASISSTLIGDTEWLPGQELPLSPWDLVRKPLSQCITIRLKGLHESCLDELALESLLPLPLLHNCVRLVEQYGNLFFHGLEGSCQEYIANVVAHCIKSKQEAEGAACDVVRVEVEESLTKEQLLETFINCGFLIPAVGSGFGLVSGATDRRVVVLLEGLEKASSLTGLLTDLCLSLDNRGSASPLILGTGSHHVRGNNFLIGTFSKPRLQGSELRLQQHFRWVMLRWDQEPLHGLLGRHLRRKLLHKVGTGAWSPDGLMERSVLWVSQVWQQLNACLSRLGTHEALLGPQLFLSCPVVPNNIQAVVRWLARLWNAVVVPRVEGAVISLVMTKRPSSALSSPSPLQKASPSNCGLSAGQQAVVKAALSILVNKAVMPGCPLPRHEMDRYLLEFEGSSSSLPALGSCKRGVGGGRRGRDSGKLRRSNTSPRKKGSPSLNWCSGGSFREGSVSSSDVRFMSNGHRLVSLIPSTAAAAAAVQAPQNGAAAAAGLCNLDVQPAGLPMFFDDETDLIRELQTMCSSRSEPDISQQISQAKDSLILFPSTSSKRQPALKSSQETSVQPQSEVLRKSLIKQPIDCGQSAAPQRRPASRSQLQSSSRPSCQVAASCPEQQRAADARIRHLQQQQQQQQPNPDHSQPQQNYGQQQQQQNKAGSPSNSSNNNYYRNSMNDSSHSQDDIWILHRDLHHSHND